MHGYPTGTANIRPHKADPTGHAQVTQPNSGLNPNPTRQATQPAKNPFAPLRLRVPLFSPSTQHNPQAEPPPTNYDGLGDFDTMI
jgi:hypothetical protein